MYLFQLIFRCYLFRQIFIYIPLCIYFNKTNTRTVKSLMLFTFHYVSISTFMSDSTRSAGSKFTFHYVSISTRIFRSLISIRIVVALLSTKQTSIIFILTGSDNILISTDKIRIVDSPVILQYYVPTVKA